MPRGRGTKGASGGRHKHVHDNREKAYRAMKKKMPVGKAARIANAGKTKAARKAMARKAAATRKRRGR